MNRLRVLWVGRTEKGFPQDAVEHYLKRIAPFARLECVEIRAASHSGRDPAPGVEVESAAILKRLPSRETTALLDESGTQFTSREFARWLDRLDEGRVTFVIGGAYGVDGRVRQRAEATISLSRLTLPHQLVRIVLLEQIYRALTLRAGHGYHHD